MVTTIQVSEQTLKMLKKVKADTNTASYNDAIAKLILHKSVQGSMAGCLMRHLGRKSKKDILAGLRDKNERF